MASQGSNAASTQEGAAPIPLTAFEDRLLADVPDTDLADLLRSRGLPGRRTETWKWSDLRGALRDERAPSEAYDAAEPTALFGLEDFTVLTIKNGEPVAPRSVEPKPIVKNGAKVGVTYVVDDGLIVSFYDEGRAAERSLLQGAELSALAALRPLISISVLPGFSHQIAVRRLSSGEGRHGDNLFVTLGEDAVATLVESHEITGSPFVNARTEIELDGGAVLKRLVVQPSAPEAFLVHSTVMRLDEPASGAAAALEQITVAQGAKLARLETEIVQLGAGHVQLDGLYRLDGKNHLDLTSRVTFEGEGAETEQLVKGVIGDQARGVFQGKFLVKTGAQHTDAKMAHHALLLSKGAQVYAKPELEIYADDVECAHGNTAGAIDQEALFYMRQRGIAEDSARSLLIDAFTSEVVERAGDAQLKALARLAAEALQ